MTPARQLILRALSRLTDVDMPGQGPEGNGRDDEAMVELFGEQAAAPGPATPSSGADGGMPAPPAPTTPSAPETPQSSSSTPPAGPAPVSGPPPSAPARPPARPAPAGRAASDAAPADHVLQETLSALERVQKRDDIARVVLDYATKLFERAGLFVIKREMVAGWEGVGEGMSQKNIRAILIPLSTPSMFKTVYETKVLYYGGVPKTTVNDLFLNALATQEPPSRVVVLPFVLNGKVVCALYADGGQADELSPQMIGQLYRIGRAVSAAFEKLIMQSKQGHQ